MNIVKWICKHICIIFIGSLLYMASFHLDILNVTGIYFYDGILRLVLIVIVMLLCECILYKKFSMDYKDVALSVCVFALLNMLWLSLCVVSLDRSLSVFLLTYMQACESVAPEGMKEEEINEVFEEVFVDEYGMLERRFNEQIASGNIVYNEWGNYEITKRGEFIVSVFKTVGKLYKVDERFIEPKVNK